MSVFAVILLVADLRFFKNEIPKQQVNFNVCLIH